MKSFKNIAVKGSNNRDMATDIFFESDTMQKPVLIYAHGFNGFKDWGNFDLVATQFAQAGFVLVKFNFSHNGTTIDHPEDFTDLEAFGQNNYTKELNDLGFIIDWICSRQNSYVEEIDVSHIYLAGHSMGGGIAILKAAEDSRVKKLVTWASVSECKTPWGSWPDEKMSAWKKAGVAFYENSRTHQKMPMYFQLFEDFITHKERLDIKNAINKLEIQILLCHGTSDEAVPVKHAYLLKEWQAEAKLLLVESDHVFGRRHPWNESTLPAPMQEVVNETIQFLKG